MTDYLSRRSMIIAVVLTAGIFIGSIGWYVNTSSAELSEQEVHRMIGTWHENNPHIFVSQTEKTEILDYHEELNEWIIKHNMALSRNFTSIAKTLENHNTQLIVLRTANQIVIPSNSQGTGDFDLKTINIQTFEITDEFPVAMPVYITGNYEGIATKIAYDIYKNGILYATGNSSISAGTFTFAFNVNADAELGDYVVTVLIDNKKDTVSFTIE